MNWINWRDPLRAFRNQKSFYLVTLNLSLSKIWSQYLNILAMLWHFDIQIIKAFYREEVLSQCVLSKQNLSQQDLASFFFLLSRFWHYHGRPSESSLYLTVFIFGSDKTCKKMASNKWKCLRDLSVFPRYGSCEAAGCLAHKMFSSLDHVKVSRKTMSVCFSSLAT